MSHFSSEVDSDVECGQETGFGHVTRLPLQGEHRHGWGTGNHPVQPGFRDLTSPEEASEWDRSASEAEMGFIARGTVLHTRGKASRDARQGFQDLLSPDEANSSEPDDDSLPRFESRTATVNLEAAVLPKHRQEYGIGFLDVDPIQYNAKYAQQVPEEDRWSKGDRPPSPMEQTFVGDLDQQPSLGDYNPPPSVGEYTQPPSVGEYPQPPSVGEYSQPPSVGEYSQPPSVGPSSRSSVTSASRGKDWDVFVSHSTGDRPWAREKVIVPLRNPPLSLKVSGSYHYMPDQSRYDNKGIESALRKSAVVIIGLSPSYLKSERCTKEWQLVSRLHQEGHCQVIVGAVQECNRPEQLKKHLYLDFLDQRKERREAVWKKLVDTLRKYLDMHGGVESVHHSDKVKWGEEHRKEDAQPVARGDRRTGGEGKGLGGSTDGEDEEEEGEEEDEGDDGDISQMEGVADYEERAEEFDNPFINYGIPMDQMSGCGFHVNTQAAPNNNKGGEAKQVESGSEEGEIADDGPEQKEGEVEEVGAGSHAVDVARHYNALEAPNVEKRKESPIFHLRNFNNWVKSVLIRTYLDKCARNACVLDLCCGKGGDLLKWKEGGISHLVCADIAETSVQQCRERYHSDKVCRRGRKPPFEAEFIVADCSRVRLRDEYENAGMRFNLTSCQFSVHYSFESQPQAHMMLRNACENLKPGGYFIGTTVDSSEVLHRVRSSEHGSISNDIFSVIPRIDVWKHIPLFGAKYDFKLHGVVDLPEYLVYFPLLVEMLKGFNMEHICHQNFYDFFTEHRNNPEDVDLMYKMQAMDRETGTMSPDEWEAIGLYMVFVFRKEGSSKGSSGNLSDTRPHKRPKHYHHDY